MKCPWCAINNPPGRITCYNCGLALTPPTAGDAFEVAVFALAYAFISRWGPGTLIKNAILAHKVRKLAEGLTRATEAFTSDNYPEVIKWVEKAGIEANYSADAHAMAYSLSGLAYRGMENWPKAREQFEKLVKLDTGFAPSVFRLPPPVLQYQMLGEAAYKEWSTRSDHPAYLLHQSIEACTRAIHLNPSDPGLLFNRAIVLHQAERHTEALSDLTSAINLQPRNAEFYAYRAMVNASLNRQSASVADLQRAIELDPSSELARHLRSGL